MAGHRNAGHRTVHAARFAAAADDAGRLAIAHDWLRASAALLARRRPPSGVPQLVHAETAAQIVRAAAAYLKELAEAIDRGDHDAK